MRMVMLIAIAMLLSGCMTSRMNKGLNQLMGQPVETAIGRLGYPDGQREIMGHTLYVWASNHQAYLPVANTTVTTGQVGGTGFSGTTTSFGVVGAQAYCTIQISVDHGVIMTYQWNGNPLGCNAYASALNR